MLPPTPTPARRAAAILAALGVLVGLMSVPSTVTPSPTPSPEISQAPSLETRGIPGWVVALLAIGALVVGSVVTGVVIGRLTTRRSG